VKLDSEHLPVFDEGRHIPSRGTKGKSGQTYFPILEVKGLTSMAGKNPGGFSAIGA